MKIKLPKINGRWKQWRYNHNREYRQRISQWHGKFAWLPLEIITDEKNSGYKTVVWFEKVMQQGYIGSITSNKKRKTM